MRPVTRLAARWPNVPVAAGVMALLLLAIGLAVIFQNEASYREQKLRETTIQADILAASVIAAFDFGDAAAAQESVDALRVNPQIDAAGIYTREGRLFAGYERRPGALPQRAARSGERRGTSSPPSSRRCAAASGSGASISARCASRCRAG